MDERDITILKAISDLGTGSPERIHEETDIPVSTIHYRLNNLRESGVIEDDLYDLDLEALGLGVTVIVEILANYSDSYDDVAEELLEIEGVTQAYFTMGETDFVVIARLSDSEKVERLIREFEAIDEVERTNSTFVIDPLRDGQRVLQSYSLETLIEELADD
jgi:DNA-binding Lrp family transcriptional regulator